MNTQVKRFLSLLVAVVMLVTTSLGSIAFAQEDDSTVGEPAKTECTKAVDCPADTHAEDCLKKIADDEAAKKPDEPVKTECTMAADCPADTHAEDCLKKIAEDQTMIIDNLSGERQQLPLYAYGNSSCQIILGQGMRYNAFSTSINGSALPAESLKAEGVVAIPEDNSDFLNFTGAGTGAIIYETDDAIYRYEITVYPPLYMHLSDGSYMFFHNLSVGQKYQGVFFTTEANTTANRVPINELILSSTLSFEDVDTAAQTASLLVSGAGKGSITYTNNGNQHIAEVAASGGNNSGNTNQGSGNLSGPHSCDNNNPHLLMRSSDGTDYCNEVTLNSGEVISGALLFYNGSIADRFDIRNASVTGTAVLQQSGAYHTLGASNYGEGAIEFTAGDTTYSLRVNCLAPAYGLYSAAVHKTDNQLLQFSGDVGKEQLVYLMWDSGSTTPASYALSVNEDGSSPVETTTAETTDSYIAFKFGLPQATSMWLHLYDTDGALLTSIEYEVHIIRTDLPRIVEVNHKGQTVTVGIGLTQPETMVLTKMEAFRYTPREGVDLGMNVGLVALNNFGNQATETAADESFFSSITDVRFRVVEWTNFDKNDSSTLQVSAAQKVTSAGRETYYARLTKEAMKTGVGWIKLSFKYDGTEYETYRQIVYSGADLNVAISADMTVADLNTILSNGDEVFWAWLVKNYPGQAAAYDRGFINLILPEKSYDGIITVDLAPSTPGPGRFNAVRFRGNNTKMLGIEAKTRVFAIENITFDSGSDTRSGTAILYDTPEKHRGDMMGIIYNCTFTNYEYAIAEKGYGFIRDIGSCRFNNCGTAILMDNQSSGSMESNYISIKENQFNRNGTAVRINSLPDQVTAFSTRIFDNNFMFNDLDFDLSDLNLGNKNGNKAHFYFIKNYFGKNENGNGNDNATRGPADIAVKNSKVKVITNPVRKTQIRNNEYWVYTGENQYSAIFGSEANNVLVDSDSLNSSAARSTTADSTEIPISIVDNNGNEIASWTF